MKCGIITGNNRMCCNKNNRRLGGIVSSVITIDIATDVVSKASTIET